MKSIFYALICLLISAFLLFYLIPSGIGEVQLNKSNPFLSPKIVPILFVNIAAIVSLLMLLNTLYSQHYNKNSTEEMISSQNKNNHQIPSLELDLNVKRATIAFCSMILFLILIPIVGAEIAVIVVSTGLLLAVKEKRVFAYIGLIFAAIVTVEFFVFIVNVPITTSFEFIMGLR